MEFFVNDKHRLHNYPDDHFMKKDLVKKEARAKNGVIRYYFNSQSYRIPIERHPVLFSRINNHRILLRFESESPDDPVFIYHIYQDTQHAIYSPSGKIFDFYRKHGFQFAK